MGDIPALSEIRLVNLDASMADELEQIELTCFPMADPEDLLSSDDICAYAEGFPEGYFVAMDGDRPVGI